MHFLPRASSLHLLSQGIGNNPINPFFLCVSGSFGKFGYSLPHLTSSPPSTLNLGI